MAEFVKLDESVSVHAKKITNYNKSKQTTSGSGHLYFDCN